MLRLVVLVPPGKSAGLHKVTDVTYLTLFRGNICSLTNLGIFPNGVICVTCVTDAFALNRVPEGIGFEPLEHRAIRASSILRSSDRQRSSRFHRNNIMHSRHELSTIERHLERTV